MGVNNAIEVMPIIPWIEIHKDKLLADGKLAVNGKPPFKIKGLEQ